MTEEDIYKLYVLQSKNVRKLKKVEKNLIRSINHYIKKNDDFQIELNTKLYALLYCTLSEAQFIQIVNTPNGFLYSEIKKIKKEKNKNGVTDAWELMLDLAFDKFGDWKTNQDLLSRREKLGEIIREFIQKPSQLRNKIAHGQWDFALNRKNTRENTDKTKELEDLNVITISRWSEIHQFLGLIIRDLIQSPKKGFHNNYWTNLTKLNDFISDSSKWTMDKRIKKLEKRKNKSA